jgi:uncharacterized protein YjbJ (UPF0337 family)
MANKETGPAAAVKGVVEGVKGKGKEVAGAVVGDDELLREGRAQRDKAAAQREVAAHEARAEVARARADNEEARQIAHQR